MLLNNRVTRAPSSFIQRNQQEPALSGNGEKMAVIVDLFGRSTVQLKDLRSGNNLPLKHLARNQPHSSPSLSWNGRYLAVIIQKGNKRLVIIEDRISGRMHPISISGDRDPIRLSLSPDASQIAVQVAYKGKWRVELFDLRRLIELDQPPGPVRNSNNLLDVN